MDRPLNQDGWLEDGLKSQPLAAMPRSITLDVMSRIRSTDARRPALLTWSDLALGFVITACIGALWFTLANLPPILVIKLRIQGILLYQDFLVNSRGLVPSLFFGMAAVLAALTIPSLYKMFIDRGR